MARLASAGRFRKIHHETAELVDPSSSFLKQVAVHVPICMADVAAFKPIADMTSLELVQLPTPGWDHALAIAPIDVPVCNATGVHSDDTAKLAVSLSISARRGLPDFRDAQRQHN